MFPKSAASPLLLQAQLTMAAATITPLENFDTTDLRLPSARDEARALFGLVERGPSPPEAVRKPIEVSREDERRRRAPTKFGSFWSEAGSRMASMAASEQDRCLLAKLGLGDSRLPIVILLDGCRPRQPARPDRPPRWPRRSCVPSRCCRKGGGRLYVIETMRLKAALKRVCSPVDAFSGSENGC